MCTCPYSKQLVSYYGGTRERWVRWMEEKIIPYQVALGVVVVGSFVAEEDPDLYVWIRRFDRLWRLNSPGGICDHPGRFWSNCSRARASMVTSRTCGALTTG